MLVKSCYMNYVLVILNLMLIVKNNCVHSVVFEYKFNVSYIYISSILLDNSDFNNSCRNF